MKTMKTSETFVNRIFEYLRNIAAHGGYYWDGVMIQPGTAVASFKSIAADTGLSRYRVKKCIASLVESGAVTITRYKCFAIITIKSSSEPVREVPDTTETPVETPAARQTSGCHEKSAIAMPPMLNRAARRRLAREAARDARRGARRQSAHATGRGGT